MLFNVILVVLIAYLCVTPYFYAKAVKFGIRLAEDTEKEAEEPIFHIPKPKKKPKMTPEEERRAQILANIDRYDGTPRGQREITAGKVNG